MSNSIVVKKKIDNFNKTITVPGDKSLSIRWFYFHLWQTEFLEQKIY